MCYAMLGRGNIIQESSMPFGATTGGGAGARDESGTGQCLDC